MKNRVLGRSPLEIAPLAFGGNVFGWTADESASFAVLDAFVDAGMNLIDTADIYGRGVQDSPEWRALTNYNLKKWKVEGTPEFSTLDTFSQESGRAKAAR